MIKFHIIVEKRECSRNIHTSAYSAAACHGAPRNSVTTSSHTLNRKNNNKKQKNSHHTQQTKPASTSSNTLDSGS